MAMWSATIVALQLALSIVWVQANCAHDHEDCSHYGACCDGSKQCYKKDDMWAGCRAGCTPGIHEHDPPMYRTPWSCHLVDSEHKDCAAQGHDCAHLGCCKDPGFTCYQKNVWWAQCLESCETKPAWDAHPGDWTCHVVGEHGEGTPTEPPAPAPAPHHGPSPPAHLTDFGLTGSHFWDCNGGSCDAAVLQPWQDREYKYAPHYAPRDPNDHGGHAYGEKLWMTGAASDALADAMGADREGCGSDTSGGGGCGQCVLVRTDDAVNKDWVALVMKKNRCPESNDLCRRPNKHMDFAVPGFDNLQYSQANVCGAGHKSNTYLSREESAACAYGAPHQCDCNRLPGNTAEQRALRKGCEIFKAWGWHHGTPKFHFKHVWCPDRFVNHVQVGTAFNHGGVMVMYDNSTAALGDSASTGHKGWGQKQRIILHFASPVALVGGVLLACLRVCSFQKPSVEIEELLELQPEQ